MTTEIITIMTAVVSEFTRLTLKNIQTLFVGAILCRGPRRVSTILCVLGLGNVRNFSNRCSITSMAVTYCLLVWW